MTNVINKCPCGSGKLFSECCEPYISDKYLPGTPEQLMRSRYTAYTLKNENYLLDTWHPSTRPSGNDITTETTKWHYLKVLDAKDDRVKFIAYFSDTNSPGKIFAMGESSRFIQDIKNEDRWYYVDGEDIQTIEVTKNMSCPCGNSKKFKRCCYSNFN